MHDCNGRPLAVGDHVMVPAVIRSVSGGPDWCNVSLETLHPMPPGQARTSLSLNSRQVAKVEAVEPAKPAALITAPGAPEAPTAGEASPVAAAPTAGP